MELACMDCNAEVGLGIVKGICKGTCFELYR